MTLCSALTVEATSYLTLLQIISYKWLPVISSFAKYLSRKILYGYNSYVVKATTILIN